MSGLEVKGVTKVYGSKRVVDNISFTAKAGQILGVLGPNGAGKTTCIRMIMGITAPDQGEITFRSEGTAHTGVPKGVIGYLPEERGLYKEARVMDILLFLASLKDLPKPLAKSRGLEWLEKFGLEDHASSKIEELSKGMAQKVQFISSVLHQPQFIVLDEPFSGLDPVSQDVFKDEIRALAASGTTVLLSSHQMNIVEELCDQIFLIHRGQKVVSGSVQDIKEQYGSHRVQIITTEDISSLTQSSLVESHRQDGSRWTLVLKDQVEPTEFLLSIPEGTAIRELQVARMSLHDIFVKIARGGVEDEGDMESRSLGDPA